MTARSPHIIGVDPGGRSTGIVARAGDLLLFRQVVTRGDEGMSEYAANVRTEIADAVRRPNVDVDSERFRREAFMPQHRYLAVESLTHPNPRLGLANVTGLIDASYVIGAITFWAEHADWAAFDRVVMVPPGGHGSAPLRAYPAELVGVREKNGAGRLRHARSAWDVAGVAATMIRREGMR